MYEISYSILCGILSCVFMFFISVVLTLFIKVIISFAKSFSCEKEKAPEKKVKPPRKKSIEIDTSEVDKIYVRKIS